MRTEKIFNGVSLLAALALVLVPAVAGANVMKQATAKGKPERTVNCDPNATGCERNLVAGQNTVVGTVSVEAIADGTLLVVYDTTGSDWWLSEIHFDVSSEPITNAAPGQFGYKPELEEPVQYFQFTVEPPVEGETCGNDGDGYYYAAHAVVLLAEEGASADLTLPTLPETVEYTLGSGGDTSYFSTTVIGSELLAGSPYPSWCIDEDRFISYGETYTARVFSSYEALPDGAVDNPDMLDEVNWLINQGFVGQTSTGCGGTYTALDVQQAIWLLVENDGLKFTPNCRVNELADAALNFGSAFEPACGDVIAVVLVPFDGTEVIKNQVTITTAQVTVLAEETECQPFSFIDEETAWACGDFIREGKNWAMFFQCCAEGGPTVNPGPPADFAKGIGVRFRSFAFTGAEEVYTGVGDLGGPPRGQYHFRWNPPGTYDFTFSFDGDETLLVTLGGSVDESYNIAADLSKTSCSLADLDRLEIVVANRDVGTTVNLNDLTLDGNDLGDFVGSGFSVWNVSDYDFSEGFVFTGTVELDGPFSTSQEKNRIELLVGCEDTTN